MATSPPTREQRDAHLDELKQAVEEWAQEEIIRLDNETKYMRVILQDRGASNAGTKNLAAASRLVLNEIDSFLRFV